MENNKQYVIYPHPSNEEIQPDLDPKDKLIYIAIRRYMNKSTLEAFPSYATITKDTGAAAKTIKKCVDNLVKENYLQTRREGRKLIYTFNNKKQFEPFSYEFLDKPELSFTEKSYIVASQQYMFKDENEGRIEYTNKELSSLIKMPETTISKCNHSLERKGFLQGASELTKRFQLRELDQLFIWKLKEHDDKINENTVRIDNLEKTIESQKKLIDKLLKERKIEKSEFIV
jgi:DNA-binding transcriptional regulator YhcF (GntR family)